jgi:hypothetical protein
MLVLQSTMAPIKRPKIEAPKQKHSILSFFKGTPNAESAAKPSLDSHNVYLDNDHTPSKATPKSDAKLPTSSSMPSLQSPSGDLNVTKLAQSTSAPNLKGSVAATATKRKKPQKNPDAPYLESKRPSKQDIESIIVSWKVSPNKNNDRWTGAEDITLI